MPLTSSRRWWTVSSCCATTRCLRWPSLGLSRQPTGFGGASGVRLTRPDQSRSPAARAHDSRSQQEDRRLSTGGQEDRRNFFWVLGSSRFLVRLGSWFFQVLGFLGFTSSWLLLMPLQKSIGMIEALKA